MKSILNLTLLAVATLAATAHAASSYEFRRALPKLAVTPASGATPTEPTPVASPQAALSPQSLDFARVLIGTSVTQQVTLTNSGEGTLSVSAAGVTQGAPAFGTQASSCASASLVQGSSCTVTANFTPTSPGAATGQLSFNTNDTSSPHVAQLSGFGYEYARFSASKLASPNATLSASLAASNTTLSGDGTTWTVGARPAGYQSVGLSMATDSAYATGRLYAEVQTTTNSAWLYVRGKSDNLYYGIALDGPGCTVANVYQGACTSNSSGTWSWSRLGVLVDHRTGAVTITRNGLQVYTAMLSGTAQAYELVVSDRDAPTNPSSRTFTLYPTPSSWQYAPASVAPFARQ